MDEKQIELKPCPFCGSAAFLWRDNWRTHIECGKYHVDYHRVQISAKSDREAIDGWNHRPKEGNDG